MDVKLFPYLSLKLTKELRENLCFKEKVQEKSNDKWKLAIHHELDVIVILGIINCSLEKVGYINR